HIIPAGGESREIDLRGHKRIIKEIVFYYKTKPRRKNDRNDRYDRHRPSHTLRASVSVWGRH
ncbi:MAG: hypothetical protein ACRCSQ_02725, partial [Bacteroidales bacterium]